MTDKTVTAIEATSPTIQIVHGIRECPRGGYIVWLGDEIAACSSREEALNIMMDHISEMWPEPEPTMPRVAQAPEVQYGEDEDGHGGTRPPPVFSTAQKFQATMGLALAVSAWAAGATWWLV